MSKSEPTDESLVVCPTCQRLCRLEDVAPPEPAATGLTEEMIRAYNQRDDVLFDSELNKLAAEVAMLCSSRDILVAENDALRQRVAELEGKDDSKEATYVKGILDKLRAENM